MYFFKVFVMVALTSAINAQFRSGTCSSRLSIECSCPPEWQLLGKECYHITPAISKTWDEAKLACQDLGGKMAAPRSSEEMNFMAAMAQEVDDNSDYRFWIACYDKKGTGNWECDGQEGGEPFLDWDDGQPTASTDNLCAYVGEYHNHKMADTGCEYPLPFEIGCVRPAACTYSLIQLRH